MGYNVQAAIKFWHIYYKCVRELSVTLILLVSLLIFVILPAIPLVLLHFIKWYLKHIIMHSKAYDPSNIFACAQLA